ncbi:hypothetical protein AZE42_11280 [Rhizopogon vesiculosus]|uniref:Uncharacterized protein n=1 Tax=Rhizopogon vesiculosus TaxID=180088 RepID=A0A1J8QEP1_9AGAM|nr:hypothetical protein AZE42_11280 [Rhizopogon vesiculosus]
MPYGAWAALSSIAELHYILSPSYSTSTSPTSSVLPTPDHNFLCILPYSNLCAPAFLPTSCRPGATSPTSRCLGAG